MRIVTLVIAFVLAGAFAHAASAAPEIDQEQVVIDTSAGFVLAIGGHSEQKLAQVVTPGRTGLLTEVRFSAACTAGLRVDVQGVTNDVPNGTVIGSQTGPLPLPFPPTFRSIVFSNPVAVTAGVPYALVLTAVDECGIWPGPVGNPYAGGDSFFDSRPNAPGVWVPMSFGRSDLPFQTLVESVTLELTPEAISLELVEGSGTDVSASLRNPSSGPLELTVGEAPEDCGAPGDVAWLTGPAEPITVGAGASVDLPFFIDSSGLTAPDVHTAKACIGVGNGTVLELPVTMQVRFPFSGFLATFADPPVLNTAHSDGVQTFWFRLGGDRGLDVVSEAASRQIDCATGAALGPAEPAETPSWAGLSYQQHTGRYSYPWKTTPAVKNTCRELTLTLSDGSVHPAWLHFVK